MIHESAVGLQCGVVGGAQTDAGEGALEAGQFLRKGDRGGTPPFEQNMGGEGTLLGGESMDKGCIIQDGNGNLQGRDDR